MTIEQIKLEGGNWPPSIAELCKRFKPSMVDFGLPEPEVAFREASQFANRSQGHEWSHRAVRDAMQTTGAWDLQHCSSDFERNRLRKIFFAEYESLCNRILQGETIDERVALLESDEMKGAIRLAEEAADRQAKEAAEKFWADRGEEPPKSANEAISRMRLMLDEGGSA